MKRRGEILFDSRLSPSGDAIILECCERAKALEASGDYEAARNELAGLGRWRGAGHSPILDGLGRRAAAELLLRAGALTGWLGSSQQLTDAQETAKDLITEGMRIFEELEDSSKAAESRMELALCYWRQAAYDEGRVALRAALDLLGDSDWEMRARVLLRAVTIERSAGQMDAALRMLEDECELFGSVEDPYLKGCFHSMRGLTYKNLLEDGGAHGYADRALLDYTAASNYFEQIGHGRYHARTENNVGHLLTLLGRHADAHEHLNYARGIFFGLKDRCGVAQVDETRARVYIAQARYDTAVVIARQAVTGLKGGDEQGLQCEALVTLGVALARAGSVDEAEEQLRLAAGIAEATGDSRREAGAALTLIEELHGRLGEPELYEAYLRADRLAGMNPVPTIISRLLACCRVVVEMAVRHFSAVQMPCDLKEAVRLLERRYIEKALLDSGGEVTRAARLLGFSHPQSLVSIMGSRHKDLMERRNPVRKRHRSVMTPQKRKQ